MRRTSYIALSAILLVASSAAAQDQARAVQSGGIKAAGWKGQIDASEQRNGSTLENAKLEARGKDLHVTTGPAVAYWRTANNATGDYTVKAKFTEEKYMNLNNHPHPYGIVIGGNDMGTPQQSYLYCAAYGNGRFIVRGFGPEPFQLNGRGEANDAVHKAAGQGQPVEQEIAVTVKGDEVSCAINGTTVGTYKKSDIVGQGKLKSTDGMYGVRFGHNTEAVVSGFEMTKAK